MTKQQAYGIDISNYAGEISPQVAAGLAAAGVTFCIVEFTDADLFERQVRALAGAGIKVSSYFFIYWSRIGGETTRLAILIQRVKLIEASGVQLGWQRPDGTYMPKIMLDFEDDSLTSPPTNPMPAQGVVVGHAMVQQVLGAGLNVGIYTGEFWWKQHMGNSMEFNGVPLWHASQFQQTVPTPFSQYYAGHEYGGWPVPMVWQHRGTSDVAGVSCDQNLEEWEDVQPAIPLPVKQPRSLVLDNGDGTNSTFIERI